jgi:hypothetical protein
MLPAGYFVALWPADASPRLCSSGVRYFGPLATREQAEWLRASAQAIGLTDVRRHASASADRHIARLLQPPGSTPPMT